VSCPAAEILEQLWGYPPGARRPWRVVDVYVARLRGKLEPDPANPKTDPTPCAAPAIPQDGVNGGHRHHLDPVNGLGPTPCRPVPAGWRLHRSSSLLSRVEPLEKARLES